MIQKNENHIFPRSLFVGIFLCVFILAFPGCSQPGGDQIKGNGSPPIGLLFSRLKDNDPLVHEPLYFNMKIVYQQE